MNKKKYISLCQFIVSSGIPVSKKWVESENFY